MDNRNLAGLAAQLLPIVDHAEEDIGGLLLGELEAATGLVEGNRDRAAHRGDLHHATAHLGGIGGADRFISGAEFNGAGNELANTRA